MGENWLCAGMEEARRERGSCVCVGREARATPSSVCERGKVRAGIAGRENDLYCVCARGRTRMENWGRKSRKELKRGTEETTQGERDCSRQTPSLRAASKGTVGSLLALPEIVSGNRGALPAPAPGPAGR